MPGSEPKGNQLISFCFKRPLFNNLYDKILIMNIILQAFVLLFSLCVIQCFRNTVDYETTLPTDDQSFGEYLDAIWKKLGGKNITVLEEVNGCKTRKTELGDIVTIEFAVKESDTGKEIYDFVEEPGILHLEIVDSYDDDWKFEYRKGIRHSAGTYYITHGAGLVDMCVGDVRKIIVPMEIGLQFNYLNNRILDFSQTYDFVYSLKNIVVRNQVVGDEL